MLWSINKRRASASLQNMVGRKPEKHDDWNLGKLLPIHKKGSRDPLKLLC